MDTQNIFVTLKEIIIPVKIVSFDRKIDVNFTESVVGFGAAPFDEVYHTFIVRKLQTI